MAGTKIKRTKNTPIYNVNVVRGRLYENYTKIWQITTPVAVQLVYKLGKRMKQTVHVNATEVSVNIRGRSRIFGRRIELDVKLRKMPRVVRGMIYVSKPRVVRGKILRQNRCGLHVGALR